MAATLSTVRRLHLGSQGLEVSAQGLGCMGMSGHYGPAKPAIKGIRDKVQLATKFGINEFKDGKMKEFNEGKMKIRGDPAYARACCEASLKRLDVDCIDLYYQHRIDTTVPIEVTIGELKKLVEEGKIKYIGLSEASASTIRRAHAVHPITAVQIEWSLWTRDAEEEIIPTCSPLGRGFLSAGPKMVENLADDDFRKGSARFSVENLEKNKVIFERICGIASKKECSPSQLALAWVHHHGNDVAPILGTTKVKNLEDNIGSMSIEITPLEMKELEDLVSSAGVFGDRYDDMDFTWMNAETPPLSSWKVIA